MQPDKPHLLQGMTVVEVGDERGEYSGLLLGGMGATIIKVEPPHGSSTRAIGPFFNDEPGLENSLHFWHYNRNKHSVVMDLATDGGAKQLRLLLSSADVLLDSTNAGVLRSLGVSAENLPSEFPRLIAARLTSFGDTGPWAAYKSSDLIHLALGGVMMNCGYDPNPHNEYDLPPMAPQVWQAYHIAGEQLLIGILAALYARASSGTGQTVTCSIHEAVSKCTELDLMSWVMRRAPLYRQTCRHAVETPSRVPTISHTKDGRWYVSLLVSGKDEASLTPFLTSFDMAADLSAPSPTRDMKARDVPGSAPISEAKSHMYEIIQRFIRSWRYDQVPWLEAQAAGLLWSPLRKPHENVGDAHWEQRGTFATIDHPELKRSFTYPVSKWVSSETSWCSGVRAPLLGEHQASLESQSARVSDARPKVSTPPTFNAAGESFPLGGIRILDFSWFLASAGGTRFAAALGAETLKVEWRENPDTRFGAMAPVGGRDARRTATSILPGANDPELGGQFNNKNAGKRGLSLNIRDPRGLEIARRLVALSDVVAEGFSPGVLEKLGLGYETMRAIRPDIIYVAQSGMGSAGTYGRLRTVGPIAAAFTGLSEMSGLPEPAMPAGWGYSYLDWIGAYGFAQAILGALIYRDRTGLGQYIDASQCEAGLFVTGPTILDWSANRREWYRTGNDSPYRAASPHGVYRCQGVDRWIAIACFDDIEWMSLVALVNDERLRDDRYRELTQRAAHKLEVDRIIEAWTRTLDAFDCMKALQHGGVPAGVCQTAADRCDSDPQLAHLEWLREVTGTKIGTWPVADVPFRLGASAARVGGAEGRGAPLYGEDNDAILRELLGYSPSEIAQLAADGVI